MGATVSSTISSAYKTAKSGCVSIKETAASVVKDIHEVLDDISYDVCPEKPTVQLALFSMNIPQKDMNIIESILSGLHYVFNLATMPAKALSDKKFSTHLYESTSFFRSMTGQMQNKTTISSCEKMLIYISHNIRSVQEPTEKQVRQTVTLGEDDYVLPVNLWYTFCVDNTKVYFYAHVSVLEGYQGILLAATTRNVAVFETMKANSLNHYNDTLGRQRGGQQTMEDILG